MLMSVGKLIVFRHCSVKASGLNRQIKTGIIKQPADGLEIYQFAALLFGTALKPGKKMIPCFILSKIQSSSFDGQEIHHNCYHPGQIMQSNFVERTFFS
jgi:hypothetical protein